MDSLPIVVFSHLRWDFVFQRPQHLLSRLAKSRRIVFIEEPMRAEGEARWERHEPAQNVTVFRPRTSLGSYGFSNEQSDLLLPMVKQALEAEGIKDYVVWCYTAMSVKLASALSAKGVVFDVMDELSAFKNAPPEMLENEKRLLELADVVFTGGPSLYRAKKDRHANVHCFPSSVDAVHFGSAKENSSLPEHEEQVKLPHPRLGFYGVIDERMDLGLLSAMAAAHPEWQIVMVGPVVKIEPSDLPRPGNIHYLGQRSYSELPRFLKGWDVCLLPFARNESTKFISPTKTLEYMAAEKQIVSTPIRDVEEPYGDTVLLGDTAEAFNAACEKALSMSEQESSERVGRMRKVLAQTSWDKTANAIGVLIDQAVEARASKSSYKSGNKSDSGAAPDSLTSEELSASNLTTKVAIIGAGPTGLSAAYHLGGNASDCLLIEQHETVGGWCRSIVDRGFTFDYAGHIMFSNDPYVHELYKKLLGDNVHWQNREAWIRSKNVYTRYPFQGALYGLPPAVISECIMGAVEARFGSAKTKADEHSKKLNGGAGSLAGTAVMNGNGHANGNGHSNGHSNGNGHANGNGHSNGHSSGNGLAKACATGAAARIKDCCGDGVAESTLTEQAKANGLIHGNGDGNGSSEPANFEEFIYKIWGAGIAKHFAIPYNRKIWAVDLKEMETSWLGGRVPLPDLQEMIRGALEPVPAPMGPNARFGYPLRGGFQSLMNGFLPYVSNRLLLNVRIVGVSLATKTLTLSTGQKVQYQQLISTMPLPVLIRMMGEEVPERVRRAAAGLRHTSVKCVNIGVNRANVTEKHWIYYPEDTVFHRIFVQGNASPHCNAPGGFGFTCEITYGPNKPLPCDGDELVDLCVKDARRAGFLREDDEVICGNVVDMPYAYVIYDHARPRNIAVIKEFLAEHDIILVGRYSEWEYFNSDHAFLAGKRGAEEALELQKKHARPVTTVRIEPQERAVEKGWISNGARQSSGMSSGMTIKDEVV